MRDAAAAHVAPALPPRPQRARLCAQNRHLEPVLRTTHHVLPTAYYLLLTAHHSLLTTHYSLLTAHHSPHTTHQVSSATSRSNALGHLLWGKDVGYRYYPQRVTHAWPLGTPTAGGTRVTLRPDPHPTP